MTQQEDVFVSYSREDNEKVLELTAKLRAAGVPLWMDVRNIDGAAMWGEGSRRGGRQFQLDEA